MLTKHFLLPLILIVSDSQASLIVKVSQVSPVDCQGVTSTMERPELRVTGWDFSAMSSCCLENMTCTTWHLIAFAIRTDKPLYPVLTLFCCRVNRCLCTSRSADKQGWGHEDYNQLAGVWSSESSVRRASSLCIPSKSQTGFSLSFARKLLIIGPLPLVIYFLAGSKHQRLISWSQ